MTGIVVSPYLPWLLLLYLTSHIISLVFAPTRGTVSKNERLTQLVTPAVDPLLLQQLAAFALAMN